MFDEYVRKYSESSINIKTKMPLKVNLSPISAFFPPELVFTARVAMRISQPVLDKSFSIRKSV